MFIGWRYPRNVGRRDKTPVDDARKIVTDIFEKRCALVNKNSVCHQCSHINEIFNPRQDQQEDLMKLELVKASKKFNREQLFTLRTLLVKAIDPLHAAGTDFHEEIMRCLRTAIGEKSDFFDRNRGNDKAPPFDETS